MAATAAGDWTFEILIPWEIFPPADRLNVERVRLKVGLSSLPRRELPDGKAARDNLRLHTIWPPIATRITPCGQPLLGRTLDGEDQSAYYFLNSALMIDKAFLFENPQEAYGTPLPKQDEVSPIASYQTFSTQALGPGAFLCAPFMSYRRGPVNRTFPYRLEPGGDQRSEIGISPPFPVKRLPNGSRLIRYGPDRSRSPNWRKAFVVYSMKVYVLTPSLQVYEALSLGAWSDAVEEYEIEWTDDWRVVTEFRLDFDGNWTAEKFCLVGQTYQSCGKVTASPPPAKRTLTRN